MHFRIFRWIGPLMGVLLSCLLLFSTAAAIEPDSFALSRFIEPSMCGGCHIDIYDQWEYSTHNLSHLDPVYNAVAAYFLKGLTDAGEIEEAESCVKCHTPVGVATGKPLKTSDDLTDVPDIAAEGVQCDFCHSATGASQMYNNGIILSPGQGADDPGIKRGPRKDAESDFHDTAYSEFHVNPGICGTCHNVRHVAFGIDLETTYDEWKNGPYNDTDPEKRVVCQGCHMYQRPGVPATGSTPRPKNPGQAAIMGPDRPHVFTHNFVGGNNFMPALLEKGQHQVKMAEERLKNAATLSLNTDNIKNRTFTVTITNSGCGHKLPTGLSNIRQMWLDINVKEKDSGQSLFAAGQPDKNGYLDESVLLYRTVFGDGQGKAVVNIAKAREVLSDNRIPPRQSAEQTFRLPDNAPGTGLTITAKLCYRIISQKVLDQVTQKGKYRLPVTIMAEIEQSL